MMIGLPAVGQFGCLFMRAADDYIPVELWKEARSFIQDVQNDVDIYKVICKTNGVAPCIEADTFCAYWNLEGYEKYPHALITLYEAKPLIDSQLVISDVMNAFEVLQLRMKNYYLVLKEKGMIE